uniref:Uncharacterized protein n=1 Tax=Ciona savignyi TaxID=51511 RepID=H2ZAW1_CIOSA
FSLSGLSGSTHKTLFDCLVHLQFSSNIPLGGDGESDDNESENHKSWNRTFQKTIQTYFCMWVRMHSE